MTHYAHFYLKRGIDSKEFNFGYNVVEKIEKDPKDPEKISASTKRFNNYHDYLKFQKVSPKNKEKNLLVVHGQILKEIFG